VIAPLQLGTVSNLAEEDAYFDGSVSFCVVIAFSDCGTVYIQLQEWVILRRNYAAGGVGGNERWSPADLRQLRAIAALRRLLWQSHVPVSDLGCRMPIATALPPPLFHYDANIYRWTVVIQIECD